MSDESYLEYDACVAFATDMARNYCFLFAYSHIAVPKLGSEDQGHKGAMALAAAAVSGFFQLCMFHLKGCSSLNAPST